MKSDNKVPRKDMIRRLLHVPPLTMDNILSLISKTSKYDKMPLSQIRLEYDKAVQQYPNIIEEDKPVTMEFIMKLIEERELSRKNEQKKDAGN
jgi:hypothetical protein